jgi:hypothetical protein
MRPNIARTLALLALVNAACSSGSTRTDSGTAGSTDTGPAGADGSASRDASTTPTDGAILDAALGDGDSGPVDIGTWTPTAAGALVRVTMSSSVAVLLDELPMSMRDRVAAAIQAKPDAFWTARASSQIALTTYRLVFRQTYYPGEGKAQLPIPPPSLWQLTLFGPAVRTQTSGHDLVEIGYTLTSTILTDADSPGISEPALGAVGGTWDEPFSLPLDPELLFQRTGYSCMDEAEFPPNSVDSERVDVFYDNYCGVETTETSTGCHRSFLPASACIDSLNANVGRIDTNLHFERIAWDASVADRVRIGPVTNPKGPDLKPISDDPPKTRVVYRYFAPDDCAIDERCVGAPGWRRLLLFATVDQNLGTHALDIGAIDYFSDGTIHSPLIDHGVYEWSRCHHHYHFMHYGSFSYGTDATSKRGFCLQSTGRYSNVEVSPLHNPYYDCRYQGIAAGWVDEYNDGIPCQWIDVTDVDTSQGAVTRPLTTVTNPDGFLCEGIPVKDANGNLVFEPTTFTTTTGRPVDRPKCNFFPGWADNNTDSHQVTVRSMGEGYVTEPCQRGQLGPFRNCGFSKAADNLTCTPGTQAHATCTVAAGAVPQVARLCEASLVLGVGLACTYQEALGTVLVDGTADLTFTCPPARSASEPGGKVALFATPAYPADAAATVSCTVR